MSRLPRAPATVERFGSVLRNRHFLLLWVAQALTQTSAQMLWFAMMVVVEETTHSSLHLSIAILTTIIPSVAFGLIAGVVVDRSEKKAVLIATNLLRGIVVLGYLLYPVTLLAVYSVNLLFFSITQFFNPAEVSMIPTLVAKRQLITATSLFNITWTASQLVGIVLLAPWLIKLFGLPVVFGAGAAIYVVATGLVLALPRGEPPARTLRSLRRETLIHDVKAELQEALRFVVIDRQTLWAMINYSVSNALMLIIVVLVPRYMVSVLHVQPEDAVFVFAPAGVGILVITALLTPLAERFGKPRLIDAGLVVTGAALLGIAMLERAEAAILPGVLTVLGPIFDLPFRYGLVPPLMLLAGILGVGYALLTVPAQALLLERAPAETRGRIFAVLLMLVNVAAIVPLVVLGSITDLLGVNTMFALLAGVIAVLLVLVLREQWVEKRMAEPP